jgi:hypothetical protein
MQNDDEDNQSAAGHVHDFRYEVVSVPGIRTMACICGIWSSDGLLTGRPSYSFSKETK